MVKFHISKKSKYLASHKCQMEHVFISQGSYNKVSQSRQHKTTEIYSHTVPEAKSPESRCWQGHISSESQRKEHFLASSKLLVVSRNPWCSMICSCITQMSASVFTWCSSLCVHVSSSKSLLVRTPVVGFRAHPNPV